MKIYLTSGTSDFMESLRKKYPNESMIVLYGVGNTVLLHETDRKSVFQMPLRYEVLDETGKLGKGGYFVFNHIPVTDEGRPVFEHHFLNQANLLHSQPGFAASRLLQPLKSDTYIILSEWENTSNYQRWKNSAAFQQIYALNKNDAVVDQMATLFSGAPYVATYQTKKDDEEL